MKKLLCLLLAALLCPFALAEDADLEEGYYEEYEDEIYDDAAEGEVLVIAGNAQRLDLDEVYALDLDGDGKDETVQVRMHSMDGEEILQLLVETDELVYDYDTYIFYEERCCAADLDGDGGLEILLSGDEASADYFTWCLKFSREKELQPVQFADANRGENTDEYFDSGYGHLEAIENNVITLAGSQDALGTWMFSRKFTLRDGRFELDDGGIWYSAEDLEDEENWEYRALSPTRELKVTMEDGSEGVLSVGEEFLVTETDKKSFVGFETRDGRRGRLAIEPNVADGWGFLVDGSNEYDCFESVPYAD